MYIYIYIYVHVYISINLCVYVYVCMYYTYIYIYTHMHMHMHIYIYIYIYPLSPATPSWSRAARPASRRAPLSCSSFLFNPEQGIHSPILEFPFRMLIEQAKIHIAHDIHIGYPCRAPLSYLSLYIYVYIYICMERERERIISINT